MGSAPYMRFKQVWSGLVLEVAKIILLSNFLIRRHLKNECSHPNCMCPNRVGFTIGILVMEKC